MSTAMSNLKSHNKFLTTSKDRANIFRYLFLCAYGAIALYPIYFVVISAFKQSDEIFLNPMSPPTSLSLDNFVRAWAIGNISVYFRNSVILTCLTIALIMLISTLAAYPISRMKFRFQGVVFIFFISGMMIPIQSTIIPLSFTFGKIGKDNIPFLILLLAAFQIPITIFLLNGFMKGIPGELEEAAVIDGCTHLRVFLQVILPLSTPAIVTAIIFNFLSVWNNLLFPLVFISNKNLQVMSIGLLSFFAERTSDYGGVMAAILIAIMPPLVAYIILQEKVEKGLIAGAVKG